MRGSPERDISSLRAFGLRGRQVLRVVCVTAHALLDVFEEKHHLAYAKLYFLGKVASGLREIICNVRHMPIRVRGVVWCGVGAGVWVWVWACGCKRVGVGVWVQACGCVYIYISADPNGVTRRGRCSFPCRLLLVLPKGP